MNDWKPKRPCWWLNGLVEMVKPDGRLLTGAIDLDRERPSARHRRNLPCYVDKAGGPYFKFPDVYTDIVDDLARLFYNGLEAGGLTFQILMDRPFVELRRNCHQLVDDQTLRNTVVYVQERVDVVRDGNTVKMVGNPDIMYHGAYLEHVAKKTGRAFAA